MTLKEIFKKVDVYNEIAGAMMSQKARVHYYDCSCYSGEHFTDYKSLAKYIRREYFKDCAEMILKADDYEIDSRKEIKWVDYFGHEQTFEIVVELTA